MKVGHESTTRWFAIGLLVMMTVCLIAASLCAVTVVMISDVSKVFYDALESIDGISPTQLGEATAEPITGATPTATVEAISEPVQPSESSFESDEAEKMLLSLANLEVSVNDPIALARRFKGIDYVPDVRVEAVPPIPAGTIQTFWAGDDINPNFQVQAEMVYASDHVYFWVEQGVDYDLKDVRDLVDDFEDNTYPTNRAFFGSENTPGVDGDPHLYILFVRGLGYSVAGYYASIDALPSIIHEYSNGHEMFYINADNILLWEEFTYGALAHEFQHMIHGHRDINEDTWLNEGFSELAALLNGFSVGYTDYAFADDPDQTLIYWSADTGSNAPNYGHAFLIVAYFLDRFGAEVTQDVISNPANGLESMDQTLAALDIVDPLNGHPFTIDDVYRDWAVAMWLNDPSFSDGRYAYQSYTPPKPNTADHFNNCPFGTQPRTVNQYGLDYIRFRCPGEYTLTFDGASDVQVVPAEPHSGDFAFWSNRGDASDMLLTRTFDFTDVNRPISFDYWIWYDIEEDFDYLYLEVSSDGGENWKILTTPSGSSKNPYGNSFGRGYTGYSSGGREPIWIKETVDLSDYAGQEVLLRFEYITDAAVHGEGLLLDDLSIAAIGYLEGFEDGEGGWEAEGFVRLYNQLPQTFRLLLIEQGSETRVREISLDQANYAETQLSLGGVYDEAILIVIGTTRYTWQPAPYTFRVVP